MQDTGLGARLQLGPADTAVPTTDETPAIYLPIWALGEAHVGRKIRVDGQYVQPAYRPSICKTSPHVSWKDVLMVRVLAFDVQTSHLLLAAPRNPQLPLDPIRTLLVDTRVALSGQSPAASNVYRARDGIDLKEVRLRSWDKRYDGPRLSFDRGSWVTVVGWLERPAPHKVHKVSQLGYADWISHHHVPDQRLTIQLPLDAMYATPLPALLEAIHLSGRVAPMHDHDAHRT